MRVRTMRGAVVLVGLAAACGPSTVATDGTGSESSSGAADTTTEGADETATGSSSGDPSPELLCLVGGLQPTISASSLVLATQDADGDGKVELWTRELVEPGPRQSTHVRIYELDDADAFELLAEAVVDGEVFDTADIDGDGRIDLLVRAGAGLDHWWLAGLSSLVASDTPQPLLPPGEWGTWLDVNGDGLADFFESVEDVDHGYGFRGIQLHLGDGTGGTTPAGQLLYDGDLLERIDLVPSLTAGQFVVQMHELFLGVGTTSQGFIVIDVDNLGTIDVRTPVNVELEGLVALSLDHVEDLNDDGVADIIAINEYDNRLVRVMSGDAEGYSTEVIDQSVNALLAAPLVEPESLELLHWRTTGDLRLRQPQGGGWPTARTVTPDPAWESAGAVITMQADGEGAHELVHRISSDAGYFLWRVLPCE